jgi:hypothetical protein
MDVAVGVGLGLSVFIFFQWVCILKMHHNINYLYDKTEELEKRRYVCTRNPMEFTVVTSEDPS